MNTNEVNKILMSLNIFPDCITNVEITRIIKEILLESSPVVMKSPRIMNKDFEKKESSISFSKFVKMMVKIAVKVFKISKDKVYFRKI